MIDRIEELISKLPVEKQAEYRKQVNEKLELNKRKQFDGNELLVRFTELLNFDQGKYRNSIIQDLQEELVRLKDEINSQIDNNIELVDKNKKELTEYVDEHKEKQIKEVSSIKTNIDSLDNKISSLQKNDKHIESRVEEAKSAIQLLQENVKRTLDLADTSQSEISGVYDQLLYVNTQLPNYALKTEVNNYIDIIAGKNILVTKTKKGNKTIYKIDASGGGNVTLMNSAAGSNEWGKITGTVTSQADLINYLNTNYLLKSNNLSDLANAATARTNLGLIAGGSGDIWVEKAGDSMTSTLSIGVATTSVEALVLKTTDGNTTKKLLEVRNSSDVALSAISATGLFLLPDGSLSAPGLAFLGDPDTGIYRYGTNLMGLVANGIRAVSVTALTGSTRTITAGDGTNGVQLNIDGAAGAGRDLVFQTNSSPRWIYRVDNTAEGGSNAGSDFQLAPRADDGTALSVALFVKRSTGNVGIGIGATTPTAKLVVQGDASGVTSIFRPNATTPSDMTQWQDSSGNTLAAVQSTGIFVLTRNAAAGSTVLVTRASGDSQNRTTLFNNGQISWSSGSAAADATLRRVNTRAMEFLSKLFVSAQDATDIALVAKGFTSQSASIQEWQNSSNVTLALINKDGGAVFNEQGAATDVRIEGDTDVNALFVQGSTDRVGFGTATPNNKVDVVGTIQADGLRLDVTATAETITATHTITISINGVNYKVPMVAA